MQVFSFSTLGLKKIFKKIFDNFIFQRIIAAAIVFLCSFFLAKRLGPEKFGYLAFIFFLVKLFLNGHLGSVSGYIYVSFNKSSNLLTCRFPLYYFIHLVIISLIILIVSKWLGENYWFAGLLFFLIIPLYVIEPILRTHRIFYISLLPDIFLYFGSFLVVLFSHDSGNIKTIIHKTMLVIVLFSILFFSLLKDKKIILMTSWHKHSNNFTQNIKSYIALLWEGFPLYLGSMAFTLFLFMDRYFLERYHEANYLGIYMLAIQLTMGLGMVISSQNFVNVVTIGEATMNDVPTSSILQKNLKWSLVIGVLSFIILIISAIIVEKIIIPEYANLTIYCIPLGLGFISFYICGSITPVIFFKGKQMFITILMFFITLLCLGSNIVIVYFNITPVFLPWFTGTWLFVYSIITIFYSNIVARKI